jgi:hypothetical protein
LHSAVENPFCRQPNFPRKLHFLAQSKIKNGFETTKKEKGKKLTNTKHKMMISNLNFSFLYFNLAAAQIE